jgi:hypothetical protein
MILMATIMGKKDNETIAILQPIENPMIRPAVPKLTEDSMPVTL